MEEEIERERNSYDQIRMFFFLPKTSSVSKPVSPASYVRQNKNHYDVRAKKKVSFNGKATGRSYTNTPREWEKKRRNRNNKTNWKKTRSEKKLFKWELNEISMMENVGSVGLVLVWLTDCEVDTTVFVCSSKFYMGTIISFECDKHEQNNLHVCVKCKTFEMCE